MVYSSLSSRYLLDVSSNWVNVFFFFFNETCFLVCVCVCVGGGGNFSWVHLCLGGVTVPHPEEIWGQKVLTGMLYTSYNCYFWEHFFGHP